MRESVRRVEAADIAFGAVLLATFAYYLHESRGTFLYADEWLLADRGHSAVDFLRPYNGHLSIVYIAVYRALFGLFGLRHYLPFRVVGLLCFCSVPLAVHLVARRRVGAGVAGLAAVAVLWLTGASLEPGALNHWLALAATVVVSAALPDRRRGADWVVFGALSFALCSAGGGIAAAAAGGVVLLCTRPPARRWLAVAVPTVAWAVWWLFEGRGSADVPEELRYDLGETVRVTWRGIRSSFDALVLGNRWAGLLLTVLFAVLLVARLRKGLAVAYNQLAWTAGLVVWWAGIISSRGALAGTETFRYEYVGAVLIVLAALPAEPAPWRTRIPSLPAAAAVLLLAAVLALANHDEVRAWGDQQRSFSTINRQVALLAAVRPALPLQLTGSLGSVGIDDYRTAIDRYGPPQPVTRATVDGRLVAAGLGLDPAPGARPSSCRRGHPVTAGPRARVVIEASDEPVVVEVRRFGDRFVAVGTVPAGEQRVLRLPEVGSRERWTVRAAGGCVAR